MRACSRLGREIFGNHRQWALICSTSTLLMSCIAAHADSFTLIDSLGPSNYSTYPTAISGNGKVVVGYSADMSDFTHAEAFRWSDGNLQRMGFSPTDKSGANGVNFDGTVIVGANNGQAFRWSATGGVTMLESLSSVSPSGNAATAVSADGSVIAGYGINSAHHQEAVRWIGTTPQGLGYLGASAIPYSLAMGISANGQVIVGLSTNASGRMEAFRWTAPSGMTGLGFLHPTDTASLANGTNADGSVIVGTSYGMGAQAFRWTAETGMVGLGFLDPTLPYVSSAANAVSANGQVIVGSSTAASGGDQAYRWTARTGMQSIESLLSSVGISIGSWELIDAIGVSADGRVIIGLGTQQESMNFQPWIVRFAETTGFISLAELTSTVNDTSLKIIQSQQIALSALGDMRFVALEQCRGDSNGTTTAGLCAFITGSASFWTGDGEIGDGTVVSGTAGIALPVAPGVMVGVGISAAKGGYDLRLGGSNDIYAYGGSAFLSYAQAGREGLQALAAGTIGQASLDVARNSMNGTSQIVQSYGSTSGQTAGVLGRLGWGFQVYERTFLTPFVEVQWSSAVNGAYAETGGPFPMAFNSQSVNETDSRLGVDVRHDFGSGLEIFGSAAWAHRLSGSADALTGEVIDLFGMSSATPVLASDWAELAGGVNWIMMPSARITGMIFGAVGNSDQPSVGVRIGFAQKM